MSISFKKETRKTNIQHNNRQLNEQEKKKHPHIDFSRSGDNKYLVGESLKELYEREFSEALAAYNLKQKRADRKIKDYCKHIEASRKTALQQEMTVQVGDRADFASGNKNRQTANQILMKWFEAFAERNPHLKVYNAVLHNDEASPHLHLNFVPVASGYTRGLAKQVSFDKAVIQQDAALDRVRPFEHWREKEVQLLEKIMKEHGIERAAAGTKHQETKNQLRGTGRRRTASPEANGPAPFLQKEREEAAGLMNGKAEPHEGTAGSEKKDERLVSTDWVHENGHLRRKLERLGKEMELMHLREEQLKKEKAELQVENERLKDRMGDLLLEIRMTYQSVKDLVSDHTDTLNEFKTVYGRFGDVLNDKMAKARLKLKMEPRATEFEKLGKKEAAQPRGQEPKR